MKIIRFADKQNQIHYGWVLDDGEDPLIGLIEGDIFANFQRLEGNFKLNDISILPPVTPSKIVCIGRNYVAHAKEHQADVPEVPLIFLKPPSAVIGDGDKVTRGTILLIVEAMKMENNIVAAHDAVIEKVTVKEGDMIDTDVQLVILEKIDEDI